jgi:hypothetical protein
MIKKAALLIILGSLLLSACTNPSSGTAPQSTAASTAASSPLPTDAAQLPTSASTNANPGILPTLPAGALFQVIKLDGSSVVFTLDDLKKFPLASLMDAGKVEEGPAIKDVLAAAGVTEYTSIHLDGSSSPADLTREQVEAGSLLDFNNHGTVKLASPAIDKVNWTKDVSLIEVH